MVNCVHCNKKIPGQEDHVSCRKNKLHAFHFGCVWTIMTALAAAGLMPKKNMVCPKCIDNGDADKGILNMRPDIFEQYKLGIAQQLDEKSARGEHPRRGPPDPVEYDEKAEPNPNDPPPQRARGRGRKLKLQFKHNPTPGQAVWLNAHHPDAWEVIPGPMNVRPHKHMIHATFRRMNEADLVRSLPPGDVTIVNGDPHRQIHTYAGRSVWFQFDSSPQSLVNHRTAFHGEEHPPACFHAERLCTHVRTPNVLVYQSLSDDWDTASPAITAFRQVYAFVWNVGAPEPGSKGVWFGDEISWEYKSSTATHHVYRITVGGDDPFDWHKPRWLDDGRVATKIYRDSDSMNIIRIVPTGSAAGDDIKKSSIDIQPSNNIPTISLPSGHKLVVPAGLWHVVSSYHPGARTPEQFYNASVALTARLGPRGSDSKYVDFVPYVDNLINAYWQTNLATRTMAHESYAYNLASQQALSYVLSYWNVQVWAGYAILYKHLIITALVCVATLIWFAIANRFATACGIVKLSGQLQYVCVAAPFFSRHTLYSGFFPPFSLLYRHTVQSIEPDFALLAATTGDVIVVFVCLLGVLWVLRSLASAMKPAIRCVTAVGRAISALGRAAPLLVLAVFCLLAFYFIPPDSVGSVCYRQVVHHPPCHITEDTMTIGGQVVCTVERCLQPAEHVINTLNSVRGSGDSVWATVVTFLNTTATRVASVWSAAAPPPPPPAAPPIIPWYDTLYRLFNFNITALVQPHQDLQAAVPFTAAP